MEFNEKLQELRKNKGLTQEELAEALFVSRTAVSKWESGRGYPNLDSLKEISRFFSVTIDDLICSEEIITAAEDEKKACIDKYISLICSALDILMALLLFLPVFGNGTDTPASVTLYEITGLSSWIRIMFAVVIGVTVLNGICGIIISRFDKPVWSNHRLVTGIVLSITGAGVFMMTRQPYAGILCLALLWAFRHPDVNAIEAETDPYNAASAKVLMKCGFRPNGEAGEEGPRYIVRRITMNTKNYTIRLEKEEDFRAVENLVRESFWNVYRPGCSEHYVIHVLRDDPAFVKELDFVMEQDGKLIGQNIFVKTIIEADDGRTIPVLTMGPIGITPELKRKGYGKALLDYSLEKAAELGYGAVLFEGNIDFYSKSGFDYARLFGIRYHGLPEGADDSFFLCKELIPGYLDSITGVYQTPQGYYVEDSDVEEFDRGFPPKEKQKLPGQIFG